MTATDSERKAREVAEQNRVDPATVEPIESYGPEKRKNYRAGNREDYYISIYPEPSKARIRTEASIYDIIGSKTDLRVPKPIDHGDNYIIVEGIDGESYAEDFEELSSEEQSSVVEEHAEALSKIHSVSVEYGIGEFGDDGFKEYESWESFIEERVKGYERRADSDLEREAAEWLKENIAVISREIQPSIVHDDFHIWNTLKGETLGVIDTEQAFFGDKVYDIVKTMSRWTDSYRLSDKFLESYKKHGDLDEDFEERIKFYRIENALKGTISAREKIEDGRDDLEKFYESDRQSLEDLLK